MLKIQGHRGSDPEQEPRLIKNLSVYATLPPVDFHIISFNLHNNHRGTINIIPIFKMKKQRLKHTMGVVQDR